MKRLQRKSLDAGVSMPETLTVLAICAVLSVVAVPSILAASDKMKLSGLARSLYADLYLARSEAIKRGGPVALCKSADGYTCTRTGQWNQGWFIFHDRNDNGVRELSEQIVQVAAPLPEGWRLSGNQNVARYISYNPSGSAQIGTLTLCRHSEGTAEARQIIISIAGRPRVKSTTAACP